MANDIATTPLTPEEIAWMNTPVTVQVPQDNQQWLDTLMEMRPAELQAYAVYNYQVPVEAAKAVGRNELIQLIVTANLAGVHGSSVLRPKYRYLRKLRGVLPPEITQRRGRLLYMTRGEADTMQVLDKRTGEWKPYRDLIKLASDRAVDDFVEDGAAMANEFSPAGQRSMRQRPTEPVTKTPPPATATQSQNLPPEVIRAALPKMNRGDLEKVAKSLGAADVSDAKFPNATSLREFIENALPAPVEA